MAVVAVVVLMIPSAASAGPFGGFARGKYLVDGERVCDPVTSPRANPRCKKLGAAAVARLGAKKPSPERGGDARFTARSRGTAIEVLDGAGSQVFRWDAGTPVGRVVAVYVDRAGSMAVIEYESRFGGRTVVDAVGVKLPAADQSAARPKTDPDAAKPKPRPSGSVPELDDDQQKKLEAALRKARRSLARRRHARAIAEATEALAIWSDNAEALYILAAAQLGKKDKNAALATLEKLATSSDPAAPEQRVAARRAKAFASLRADPRYRKAVGITADPNRPLTAYERLMGFGGKWEQRLIACDQPEVKLSLRSKARRFILKIRGRCGGPAETTFLDGTWKAAGTDELALTFPNPGAGDETLSCQIERCRDSSGEDCVRCRIGEDEFLLRVVRR